MTVNRAEAGISEKLSAGRIRARKERTAAVPRARPSPGGTGWQVQARPRMRQAWRRLPCRADGAGAEIAWNVSRPLKYPAAPLAANEERTRSGTQLGRAILMM